MVNILQILQQSEKHPGLSPEFKNQFDKLSQSAQDATAELKSAMTHVFTLLANPQSDMHGQIRDYWVSRSPGGQVPRNLSVGQIIEGIEMTEVRILPAENSESVPRLAGEGEQVAQVNKSTEPWLKRMGGVKGLTTSILKLGLKAILHAGAMWALFSFFAGNKSHMSVTEMGTAICALTCESMTLLGSALNNLFKWKRLNSWAMAKGGVYQSATKWFTSSIKAGQTIGRRFVLQIS